MVLQKFLKSVISEFAKLFCGVNLFILIELHDQKSSLIPLYNARLNTRIITE